jgi:hypothetical protein
MDDAVELVADGNLNNMLARIVIDMSGAYWNARFAAKSVKDIVRKRLGVFHLIVLIEIEPVHLGHIEYIVTIINLQYRIGEVCNDQFIVPVKFNSHTAHNLF